MNRVVLAFICFLAVVISHSLSAQANYQIVPVIEGANITGTVMWSGPQPHLATFAINKDPEICDPELSKRRDLERLVIGPTGGVANTIVFLKDVSQGKAFDFPQRRRFLDQRHCRYEPHILLVPQNGVLQMTSSDATLHTIHMDGAASYNQPFPFPQQIISREMPSAGLVNLKCNGGHTWMNAEMMVAPHPYYAVTDEGGRFELSNVPPGRYEIVAWHEGWNVSRRENTFDVLTERRIQRPIFSDPKTWEKTVTLKAHDSANVNFMISGK
jgi:hypothetical protein